MSNKNLPTGKFLKKGARIIIQVAQLHAIAGRNMGMVLCGS
ncbi:MAG: hypothetical protein V7L05_02695 [Nostoc sp.]